MLQAPIRNAPAFIEARLSAMKTPHRGVSTTGGVERSKGRAGILPANVGKPLARYAPTARIGTIGGSSDTCSPERKCGCRVGRAHGAIDVPEIHQELSRVR